MDIHTTTKYLGRDKYGDPVIDYDNSGTHTIGIFANIEGIALIVVKVYAGLIGDKWDVERINRWDIVDEFVTYEVSDINTCKLKLEEFIKKYDVKHFLGNTIGSSIIQEKSHTSRQGQIYEGWETVALENEHMLFIVQCNIKNIGMKPEFKDAWFHDLKTFDLKRVRDNEKTYPRVFALACIIEAANPHTWFLDSPEIPNKIIEIQ